MHQKINNLEPLWSLRLLFCNYCCGMNARRITHSCKTINNISLLRAIKLISWYIKQDGFSCSFKSSHTILRLYLWDDHVLCHRYISLFLCSTIIRYVNCTMIGEIMCTTIYIYISTHIYKGYSMLLMVPHNLLWMRHAGSVQW